MGISWCTQGIRCEYSKWNNSAQNQAPFQGVLRKPNISEQQDLLIPKRLVCLRHRVSLRDAQTIYISAIILVKFVVSIGLKSELVILKTVKIFGSSSAPRCQAKSKRSGVQCRKPAIKGKQVCRTHGGLSSGPKTSVGRQKCAKVKTIHGWETRAIRSKRDAKLRELREMQRVMKGIGLIS